jgi:hypothetical protein
VHRAQASLSHAGLAFLAVVKKLAAEKGHPFAYRVEYPEAQSKREPRPG